MSKDHSCVEILNKKLEEMKKKVEEEKKGDNINQGSREIYE